MQAYMLFYKQTPADEFSSPMIARLQQSPGLQQSSPGTEFHTPTSVIE